MNTSTTSLKTIRASGVTAVQQRRILNSIAASVWSTRAYLAEITPYEINVVTPRVLELIARGYVKESGKTRTRYPRRVLLLTEKGRIWIEGAA